MVSAVMLRAELMGTRLDGVGCCFCQLVRIGRRKLHADGANLEGSDGFLNLNTSDVIFWGSFDW